MKKIIPITLLFLCSSLALTAQDKASDDKESLIQIGFNATGLLAKLIDVNNALPVRTTPYDFHLTFFPKSKVSLKFGLGYEIPEKEADSGAIDIARENKYAIHSRIGVLWNYRFFNKWVLSSGPEFLFSREIEQEFSEERLLKDIRTRTYGLGASSNLQYFVNKRFSLGVEMALHNMIIIREQVFPNVLEPFPNFIILDFLGDLRVRLFAPIEIFAYYRF